MSAPIVETRSNGTLHSPFTGQPADDEEGPNEDDPTLLFIWHGNAGLYGYVGEWTAQALRKVGIEDPETLAPSELAARLEIPGALVLRVDAGRYGVNFYGFAPSVGMLLGWR